MKKRPISIPAYNALGLYRKRQYAEVRAYAAAELSTNADDFGLWYLDGLAACRLGDLAAGVRAIKHAAELFPNIDDFYCLEAVNRRRGIVAVADHMEAKFDQYRQTAVSENFLISYPKCGRTWIRLVLGKYVLGNKEGNPLELAGLTERDERFPTTVVTHDDFPHLIRSDEISENKAMYSGKRIAFLVRDPRDVMVSNYFQFTKRKDNELISEKPFSGNLSDFLRHDIGGLKSLIRFYNIWADNRDVPGEFKIFRYEDFLREPLNTFETLIRFLKFPTFDDRALLGAVEFGRFENMQDAEKTNAFDDLRLYSPDWNDPESRKIRKGKAGGYVDYLSTADMDYCDRLIQDSLDPIYECYK